jgi:hypothetical protein
MLIFSRRDLLKKFGVAGAYIATASLLGGCRGVGVFDALSRSLSATHFTADVREVVGPCDARVWGNIAFDPMYAATVAAESRVVRVEGGEANLSLALPPNGVVLVHVEPGADK